MKKFLVLMLALSSLVATTTKAINSPEQGPYVRADFGGYWNVRQKVGAINSKMGLGSGSTSPNFDMGLGYNVQHNFRIEGVYTQIFKANVNGSRTKDGERMQIKAEATIQALMFNSIYDVYEHESGSIFIGGGIGIARVSDKINIQHTYNDDEILKTEEHKVKLKAKNNFAYNLIIGGSYSISEQASLDLQYNWADYGHAKAEGPKIRRRGHGVKMGIRYSL